MSERQPDAAMAYAVVQMAAALGRLPAADRPAALAWLTRIATQTPERIDELSAGRGKRNRKRKEES